MTTTERPAAVKLTPTMREALALMTVYGRETVQPSHTVWRVRSLTKNVKLPCGRMGWTWCGVILSGTMTALERRGLVEVKYPFSTPGLYTVTAFPTEAGRAALAEAE